MSAEKYKWLNLEGLVGMTKKQFCEMFKHANKKLAPLTIEDVWEDVRKDIPKLPKK